MKPRTHLAAAALAAAAVSQLACQSLLPRSRSESESPWQTFQEARATYDQIEPGTTTLSDLEELGLHPYANPNVSVMTYMDVYQRFVPNGGILLDQHDPAVQRCIEVRERCTGLLAEPYRERDREHGNFLLNFFEFRTQTEVTGWLFAATLVLVDDVVVYKLWEGEAAVLKRQDAVKPLGFLQDFEIQFKLTFP